MTFRAVHILQNTDILLAEDTRSATRLLNHFKISKKIYSYYSYNENKRIPFVIRELQNGKDVTLIPEAGTPLISDPGHKLVKAAIKQDIHIIPVPGASAVLSALVASGLPTSRFVFEGFLPRKKGRKKLLEELALEPGTLILYESPYRIEKTIEDIEKIFGNRYIVLAREITKKFEEFIRGYVSDISQELAQRHLKGEIVILIAGTKFHPNMDDKTGNRE
jgi:16S rRNA (cytidine1402-2'-O)-methyltransferase